MGVEDAQATRTAIMETASSLGMNTPTHPIASEYLEWLSSASGADIDTAISVGGAKLPRDRTEGQKSSDGPEAKRPRTETSSPPTGDTAEGSRA